MKNRIIFILLCSAMCLLLAGCTEKTADESQLKANLYSNNMFSRYANELDMEITSLEILKRQTTTESKTDKAWVMIEAASNAVKGTMYYVMTYNLYNDGWLLESVQETDSDSWLFTPLKGVEDDVLNSYLPAGAETLENNIDLEMGGQYVRYSYVEPYTYCDIVHEEVLKFDFLRDYSGGVWVYNSTDYSGCHEEWKDNILGTWSGTWDYNGSERSVSLHLSSFAAQGNPHQSSQSNPDAEIDALFHWQKENLYANDTDKTYQLDRLFCHHDIDGFGYGYWINNAGCNLNIWYDAPPSVFNGSKAHELTKE